MKTCKKCNYEFDDFEKVCPNCNELPDGRSAKVKWIPVITVRNDIEFEMIKDVLEMADIPAIRSVKGIDNYAQIILGVPIAGIDVLVPDDRLEEAGQLLAAKAEDTESEDID